MTLENGISKQKNEAKIVNQKTSGIFSLYLREDGILHCHISDKEEYNLSYLPALNTAIGEMINYTPVPVMVTVDEAMLFPFDSRETLARKSAFPYSKAVA